MLSQATPCKSTAAMPLPALSFRHASRGFTLIEIMIAVTLLAVLLVIALPEMRMYMLNSSIRGVAHAFVGDLAAARAEAIRTNEPVSFTVTSTANPATAEYSTLAVNGDGPNWVSHVVPQAPAPVHTSIGAGGGSGSGSSTTAPDPRLLSATLSKQLASSGISLHKKQGAAQFKFNGLGATDKKEWIVFQFTHDTYNPRCELADNAIRCLQVEISPSGSIRLCEPGRDKRTDNRACRKQV